MLARIVLRLIEDALRWLMLLARSDESVRAEKPRASSATGHVHRAGNQAPIEWMPLPEPAWRC
jgi:hypothetical protein